MAVSEPTSSTQRAMRELGLQRNFVDGQFRDALAGGTFDTLNPVTNEVLAQAADGRAEDVVAAVAAARRAFDDGPWPRMVVGERARILRQIADAIRTNADELIALECLDIGMPISQMHGLAARAAENFDYFASAIEQLHGRAFQVGDEFINYTVHKPAGVAALIMPWNAPLMLSTWRIAPCLAAGNTLVLKPAEWSPLTATRLAELIGETDLPPGVFNLVHGYGETAGAPLAAHPDVQLVCFTGEGATAEKIMAGGAPTLKRYSFELGGKSPVVVFADSDTERAVDAAVAQIFSMNGQRCTAGSRLLVEQPIYDDFVAAVAERARAIRIGDPFEAATELGPLIRPEHHQRVSAYIESALADGAELLAGGGRPVAWPDGNFLEATVLGNVAPGTEIFDEEVFGPVLVATPFADEAQAIALANATEYGLAAYVWTSDVGRAHRVAQAIDTGLCWINSHNVRDLRTPFGGTRRSGIGREGGDYSFEFYCELETVHVAISDHRIPRLGLGGEL
jgi:5-carboxymethyl-2-hydroxymuconic-semialdehyde dehydrogenase